jgi:toxin ParE1/3/4
MSRYIFSKEAEKDLIAIYRYGYLNYGENQAERYQQALKRKCQFLSDNPYLYRERTEFNPPMRFHPHQKHLIIYLAKSDHILIVRILHERMDVEQNLDA